MTCIYDIQIVMQKYFHLWQALQQIFLYYRIVIASRLHFMSCYTLKMWTYELLHPEDVDKVRTQLSKHSDHLNQQPSNGKCWYNIDNQKKIQGLHN